MRLVIEANGSISVYVGSSSVGQGVETVLAQIAADALEVPMDRINNVFHGSTDYLDEGFGSYSSRTIVMGGSAIVDAAGRLREAIREAAAQRLNCAVNAIAIDRGMAVGPGRAAIDLRDPLPCCGFGRALVEDPVARAGAAAISIVRADRPSSIVR